MEQQTELNKGKKRLKKTPPWIKFLFLVGILAVFIIFLLKEPLFNITKIQVTGNEVLRTSEVIDESGITNGDNIFTLSKKSVADKILKLPYIKNVKVKKNFPNKVVIEVDERVNTAAYRMQEQYYLIDDDGILLEITQEPIPGITIIGGLDMKNLNPGDRTFAKLPDRREEGLIDRMITEEIFHDFHVIMLEDLDHIYMEMHNGIHVEFGGLNEAKYKISFLSEILDDIELKGLNVKSILMDQGTKPVIVTND